MNLFTQDQRLFQLKVEMKKNKLKGVSNSQSKHIKFGVYKKCLYGAKYQQEYDNYLLRSLNPEK